jgi:outer membrane protein
MKKIIIMLMLLAPMATFAQKFGHVDTDAIVQSLPDYSRAKGEIEAVAKQYENELQASQEEFQRQADDYEKKKSSMNATQQQETENSLQEKYQRIQQQAQQNQQDFQKAQQEKLQPIFNKVRQAIETVAKAGQYVYVMDTSAGTVLYINDTISKDLTAEVKAQLTKMK